jgi:hypothetical protein
MGFLVAVFVVFFLVSLVRRAGAAAKQHPALPPGPWDAAGIPRPQVLQLGEPVQALFGSEESSSELVADETLYDHDLELAGEAEPLERAEVGLSTVPRPLPPAAATLEHEVDWEQEHVIFHRRYVDAHAAPPHTAHALMNELRDPHAARRAILLAEILAPPLSMRGGGRR